VAGQHDRAAAPAWGEQTPARDETAWTERSWDEAAWRLDADREPVGVSTAERRYGTAFTHGLPPVPQTVSGAAGQHSDDTGPVGPIEWRHRSGGDGDTGHQPRVPSEEDRPRAPASPGGSTPGGSTAGAPAAGSGSAPLPPLPPGAWSRMRSRADAPADGATTSDIHEDTVAAEPVPDWDLTGGLEVIGAHVEDEPTRRGGRFRRSRRPRADLPGDVQADTARTAQAGTVEAPQAEQARAQDDTDVQQPYDEDLREGHLGDEHADDEHSEDHRLDDEHLDDERLDEDDEYDDEHGDLLDEDIPDAPYDGRRRRTRRRRRVAVLVALVIMAALAAGVVLGGQKVIDLINPPDYSGQGTGSVHVRVAQGDTLKAIGQTMVDTGVIASVRPFTDAAGKDPRATSIAPGIYGLHSHMSGKAALSLLLDPKSRLVSRVTIPEGLTVQKTLQRVAQGTGTPVEQLQTAAADTASLGLPAYAGTSLEGFLYPATYDFEPGTTPVEMLKAMVARGQQVLTGLGIPEAQRLTDVTLASIVQAESAGGDDMAKVARVLDNRLAIGMPLQLDTTVNYANNKSGLTTTSQDRANPSPYNTYLHPGLPPGPISNPGEQALKAVLAPAQGNWLYFVVVDPDTGETRFATTAEEHAQNVTLFQQWLKQHPGR
jgi:UPF0755 protein